MRSNRVAGFVLVRDYWRVRFEPIRTDVAAQVRLPVRVSTVCVCACAISLILHLSSMPLCALKLLHPQQAPTERYIARRLWLLPVCYFTQAHLLVQLVRLPVVGIYELGLPICVRI